MSLDLHASFTFRICSHHPSLIHLASPNLAAAAFPTFNLIFNFGFSPSTGVFAPASSEPSLGKLGFRGGLKSGLRGGAMADKGVPAPPGLLSSRLMKDGEGSVSFNGCCCCCCAGTAAEGTRGGKGTFLSGKGVVRILSVRRKTSFPLLIFRHDQ